MVCLQGVARDSGVENALVVDSFRCGMSRPQSHDALTRHLPLICGGNPLNLELKLVARPSTGSQLTPELVTDRDCVLTFNDPVAGFRWGIVVRGHEYRLLIARWLDDLWGSIPDTHLVYSRNGLNKKVLELVRKEAETVERIRV